MSFDLYFVAYQQQIPTVAAAEEIRMQENPGPLPEFDARRESVIGALKSFCPEYQYTVDAKGPQYGGLLDSEEANCPDVYFEPAHAFASFGFQSDPEWSRKVLLHMADVFVRNGFAIYDPANERLWSVAELEASMPLEVRDEGKADQQPETQPPRKPWWKLW